MSWRCLCEKENTKMKHIIQLSDSLTFPVGNWTSQLVAAIEKAVDGDVIIVLSDAMKELGQRAARRMCPDKKIIFKVKEKNNGSF